MKPIRVRERCVVSAVVGVLLAWLGPLSATHGQEPTPPCLIALEADQDGAFNMRNNARIDIAGCGIHVNSVHPSALSLTGSARLAADAIAVGGGDDLTPLASIDPDPDTQAKPIGDPLAGIKLPEIDKCTATNMVSSGRALLPGVYCGGIELRATSSTTLAPGTYVLTPSSSKPGRLVIGAGATLIGNGVTIILAGMRNGVGSTVDMGFNSNVILSAPSTGPYAGVVVFQDRGFSGQVNRVRGGGTKRYHGAIYLPTNDLVFESSGAINSDTQCPVFIARRFVLGGIVSFTGAFDLGVGCPAPLADLLEAAALDAQPDPSE